MIKVNQKVKIAIEYFAIAFGAAIMAIGIGVFLVDAKVVPGGVSGLSMSVHLSLIHISEPTRPY